MSTAVATDSKALVQQLVKKVTTIATLPEVTTRIIKIVENPRSCATELHQVISHDPALVTRILKVVNSAFYGLPGQIGSIERAIVLLGLNAVKNIAVAASLGQLFRGVKLCEEFTAKDLWTHCVAVGVTAREFAKQLKIPIADEAFLAGMIHDIGIMVSLQASPEQLKQVCDRAKSTEADFCQIEREIMGVDHQQLGMALAESWKFPRPCQLVAGYHHQPSQLADSNRTLVTLVHVADIVCAQEGQGFNLTAIHQAIDPQVLQSTGLDAAMIDRVRKSLPTLMLSAAMLG